METVPVTEVQLLHNVAVGNPRIVGGIQNLARHIGRFVAHFGARVNIVALVSDSNIPI